MLFQELTLKKAHLLELDKKEDERGYFARSYCAQEFEHAGIPFVPVQANVSYSRVKGTLRGMHYQAHPHEEAKLVRCIKGSIYDVIIDLRPDSDTQDQWIGVTLSAENKKMLYVPEGFAHGFLTLEEDTEVSYLMSAFYHPNAGKGIRWDDPAFNIDWPAEINVTSEKDKEWPRY